MAAMHEMPVTDPFTDGAPIRADGTVMRDMLQIRVKSPEESTGEWDYYEIVGTLPAEEVWPAADQSVCSLNDTEQSKMAPLQRGHS